jgi:uncharacterized repeat protein (TIGR01451 family)
MIRNVTHRGPGWRRAFALAASGVLIGAVVLVGATALIANAAAPITSGNLSPTANHAPNQWTNPGNAWDGDGTNYATATQNNDQGYASFGLPAIPTGSIVTGIRVTAVAKTTDADCDLGVSLSWDNGTSTTGRQDQSIGTSDTTVTFGGVPGASGNDASTFGRVWSPSELTNANFVAIVRSVDTGSSCSGSAVTSLKSIQVAVAYRPGTAGTANPAIVPGAICGQADFDFVVDTSGSIGDTNMATIRSQLQSFANTYQTGGDGRYSLTSFSSAASTRTAGFVNAATFNTAAANLPNSGGRTWTAAGISTGAGNNANDRAGVPNMMFVITDGSPNMNSASQPSLSLPQTWQDGADAAIGAANAARGSFVVNAVFVGTGDPSLPFTSAYDTAYTQFVMTQIGGGGYSSIADFGNIANGLLDLLGCRNIVVTKVTDLHPSDTQFSGSISNAQDNGAPAAWSVTSMASGSTTRTSTTVSVGRNHAHVVTEDPVPSGWTLVGWYGPISTTALCPTDPGQYSGTSVAIPSGTANQQVCVFNHFAAVPALTLDKTTSTASYDAVGQSISYSYLLTNSGNVSLVAPYSVSDDKATVTCPQTPSPLAPGASITCTASHVVTQADLDAGSVTNHATGQAFFGQTPVTSNEDQVTVNAVQRRTLSLDKTATPPTYSSVGTVISYSYLVTNTGNVTLAGPVTVSDDKATVTCPAGGLAPGASMTCSASYTITQADLDAGSVTNTAQAHANGVDSNEDTATVTAVQNPQLTLDKTTSTASYDAVGQSISYSYLLTNSGNVSLVAPYSVADDKATVTCPQTPSPLAPGASITCTASHVVTQADLDAGSVTNHATGQAFFGQTPVTSNEDQVTVEGRRRPAISITKGVSLDGNPPFDPSVTANVGSTVHYRVVVTNTGNVTLTGVTLTDSLVPGLGGCAVPATLAPGGSFTCDYTDTVALGVVDNTATADADQVASVDDTARVTGVEPNLDVVKTVDAATAQPGDVLTYTITLPNTGSADATDVDILDDVSALSAYGTIGGVTPAATGPGDLEWAGQTIPADGNPYTYSFTLTLNGSGWKAGDTFVKNTVVVSGTPNPCAQPDVPGVPPCGTTTVVTTTSNVTIEKSVNPTTMVAGQVAPTAYTIIVRNQGNGATAGPVVVTDLGMPAFFTQTSITCTSDPGDVDIPAPTCDYGDLVSTGIDVGTMAAGETITIVIGGVSFPTVPGQATNTAYACPGDVAAPAVIGPDCANDDATIVVTQPAPSPTPTPTPVPTPVPTPTEFTPPPFPSFTPEPTPPTPAPTLTPTPEPTIQPTPEPTPTGSVESITSKPTVTPPPTNTGGSGGSGGSLGLAAALALLVVAAGTMLLLTPSRRRARR